MNRSESVLNLTKLIKKYIVDEYQQNKLISEIKEYDIKYILNQLDTLKSKEYSDSDKELIMDIFFYYG